MKDEITINLRALTEDQRDTIEEIMLEQLFLMEDETLAESVITIQQFSE